MIPLGVYLGRSIRKNLRTALWNGIIRAILIASRPTVAITYGNSRYTRAAVSWNRAARSPAEKPAVRRLNAFHITGYE